MYTFVPFANENGIAVLVSIFPAGIYDPNDNDNYKVILYRDTRFEIDALKSLPIQLVVGSSDSSVLHHVARKQVPILNSDLPTRLDHIDRLEPSLKLSIGAIPTKTDYSYWSCSRDQQVGPTIFEFLLSALVNHKISAFYR